jgi:molybdenum cofactor synthesis domain-containing protein
LFAEAIATVVKQWCDPAAGADSGSVDLLLTSGGTGFGLRDLTPETLRPLLHREAPGVAQALLNEGLKHTPLAVLSRPVVGTRHSTFIATLPGRFVFMRSVLLCALYFVQFIGFLLYMCDPLTLFIRVYLFI